MKTFILVWSNKICNLNKDNHNNFWGLGDVLRGTMSMFQLSKKYNFKLIVDIQLHPISQFLKYENKEYNDLIKDNKDNIPFFYPDQVESFIRDDPRELNFFFTNNHLIEEVSEECKDFIKNILIPKDDFSKYIEDVFKSKNIPSNYNIFHFRLGDSVLIRNEDINYNHYIDIINNRKESNDVLMSDSMLLKEIVMNNNINIYLFHINIVHLGFEEESNNIRDTLLEFFVTTKAQNIKTYTVYGHISGFVNIAHIIYNIPLEKIN